MQAREDQTIVAQCTPQGNGALALIRLSGNDAVEITHAMAQLPGTKTLTDCNSHTIHYGHVVDTNNDVIDQVMFLLMRAPKTFTGHDTVEITCHNNPFLIDQIIQQACYHGARPAEGGEFTRRAVSNSKIDITQAEAIHDIITAQSQASLKKSLSNLEGTFSKWLAEIEQYLTKALAWSEASFDFLEDEDGFAQHIKAFIDDIRSKITYAQQAFDSQKQIRDGVRIAIVGSVNAGKSSLFNTLTQHERAIVTDIEGTTRDSIEAGLYRDGIYWTLVDTAGLRQTEDTIEQEGIKRSFDEAEKADVLIIVADGSRQFTDDEASIYHKLITQHTEKSIVAYNKIDATHNQQPIVQLSYEQDVPAYTISTQTHTNVASLEQAINNIIHNRMHHADTPFLINQRQAHVLKALEQKLETVTTMLDNPDVQYELVSYHLQEALEQLSDLTGKSISEAGMDKVFTEFCVGK